MKPVLLLACLLWCAGCVSGSGYSFDTAHDERYRTIAVPIFNNQTFEPGLERLLTEAVVKEIQTQTSWAVVDESSSETLLTGVITDAERRVITVARRTGLVEEMGYSITIDFEWRDLGTGDPIVRRNRFTASGLFVPARPSAERQEVGRHGAIDRLARDLVAEMRTSW